MDSIVDFKKIIKSAKLRSTISFKLGPGLLG